MATEQQYKTVLWSGGYDSTALVLEHLSKYGHVATISFCLGNNERQVNSERLARASMMAAFRARGYRVQNKEVTVPVLSTGKLSIIQPVLWAFYAALECDSVEFAYVKHDDFWHFKAEMASLLSSLQAFRNDGSPLSCDFPYEWSTKEDLLEFYLSDSFTLSILLMVSSSEYGSCLWDKNDDKCKTNASLWEEALRRLKSRDKEATPMPDPLHVLNSATPMPDPLHVLNSVMPIEASE